MISTGQSDAPADDNAASRKALFQPFEWCEPDLEERMPSHLLTKLAGRTRDIASGVAVLVELFERDDIDVDSATEDGSPIPPLLAGVERGDLMRLAVTSLKLLAEESARALDYVHDLRYERAKAAKKAKGGA